MSVEIGEKAPDFTLPTDGNGSVTLSALKGKKVVLYFYPKDDTSGCKSMYGRKYMGIERCTFLIDREGVVRGVWHKVRVPGHVAEVLKAAQAL
jgi:peroxiredoxin